MESKEAYEIGLQSIKELWGRRDEDTSALPPEIRSKIAGVISEKAQKSHRYALITQLLLKHVLGIDDSRQLEDFGDDGFSARSFAKFTVSEYGPVSRRLGNSDDPYVSNPLRKPRLIDELTQAPRGAKGWEQLLITLDEIDQHPEHTELALIHALALANDLQEAPAQTKVKAPAPEVPTDLTSLRDESGMEQNLLLDILEVLESDQPQVILAGPPGTSKTHTAQTLASYLTDADDSRVTTVQLHATYGYEDFVEGLRPVASSTGTLTFKVEPGVLRRVAEDVQVGKRHVLILDEMNRANLPRVIGELLFAIERRGEPVDLLYTKDFRLPPEICFIGTMNTADRNIRSIDAAVRRRFMVFDLDPSVETLKSFYQQHDNEVTDLFEGFEALNDQLTQLLDRHHTIGHTYLMDRRGMTTGRLNQIWLRQLRPLIEEYLFDLPDELPRFTVDAFWPSATT